jgi:hypothetical protein
MSVSVTPEFDDAVEIEGVPESARLQDARADVPITETTERFLRALLARVPLDRVEELYLFAPLRQGAVETGIAVIAARVIEVPKPDAPAAAVAGVAAVDETGAGDAMVDQAAVGETRTDEAAMDEPATDEAATDEPATEEPAVAGASADENSVGDVVGNDVVSDADVARAPVSVEPEAESVAPVRHTVYTARYRLIIKGPERGKWEIDVVDEADAPLLTVETVVRGVQRRSGEETATVRYDAAQLSHVLHLERSAP